MEPDNEPNSKNESEQSHRSTPESELSNQLRNEVIPATRFIELLNTAFADSMLYAVIERLRVTPPKDEFHALEQCQHLFEIVGAREDALELMGELLFQGALPQGRFLIVRAKALEIMLRPEPVDIRVINAAFLDLNSEEDNFSAKCLIAESLNKLPIKTVEVADSYLRFYGHRTAEGAENRLGNDNILALLSPKFEVQPSEKILVDLCQDVKTLVQLGLRVPVQTFRLLGRVGSELAAQTLEDVASGEVLRGPKFLEIAQRNPGQRALRTALTAVGIHLVGVCLGATSWLGEPQNWLTISAMSAAFHFVWRPFFEFHRESFKIAPDPHPINAIRAVLALGAQLPDPAFARRLGRLLEQADLNENTRGEVARALCGLNKLHRAG